MGHRQPTHQAMPTRRLPLAMENEDAAIAVAQRLYVDGVITLHDLEVHVGDILNGASRPGQKGWREIADELHRTTPRRPQAEMESVLGA